MDLKKHYDALWNQSFDKFKRGEFEFDPFINSDNDTRYGLTLIVKPSANIRRKFIETLEEIKTIVPNQYYYPESDLHVTVLTLISCYPGFTLNALDSSEYIDLIYSAIESASPFHIQFRGLTASPSCILIQGFPDNDHLDVLRNTLRKAFKKSDLEHSIDKRYIRETAHVTAIRFKEPLKNEELFLRKIMDLRKRVFGHCLINKLELAGTNWYHQREKTQQIHTFALQR